MKQNIAPFLYPYIIQSQLSLEISAQVFLTHIIIHPFFLVVVDSCNLVFLCSHIGPKNRNSTRKVQALEKPFFESIDESICTHYSIFENMVQFATLKKTGFKIWDAKNRCKKQSQDFFIIQKFKLQAEKNMVQDLEKLGLMQPFIF